MDTVAQDLRELVIRIERVTRESRAGSIASEQVRALCDYLTLRALVIELQTVNKEP